MEEVHTLHRADMINNFARIVLLVISLIFGTLNSIGYIINEINVVANRPNLEGYFNPLGMVFAIAAVAMIITAIPSLICQIKLLQPAQKGHEIELIDEDFKARNARKLKNQPSKFLKRWNLIFSISFVINGLASLFHGIFVEPEKDITAFVISIATVLILCGLVLSIDAIKVLKTSYDTGFFSG